MKVFDLFDIYNQIKDQNILIEFYGPLSQEILIQMGDNISELTELDRKIKKIFSVFIELAQNIMKYSAQREFVNEQDRGVGIILLTQSEKFYNVYSGNMILNPEIPPLTSNIDKINASDEIELKNMYREQSKKPLVPGQQGAGLGFIEIARKASGKIHYQLKPIDNNFSFLIIVVQIEREI